MRCATLHAHVCTLTQLAMRGFWVNLHLVRNIYAYIYIYIICKYFSPSLNSFPYTQPNPLLTPLSLSCPPWIPSFSTLFTSLPPFCLFSPLFSPPLPLLSLPPSLSSLPLPFPLLSPHPSLFSLPCPSPFSLPCPSPSLLGPAWSSWSPRRARFTRS